MKLKLNKNPLLRISRSATRDTRVVYLAIANRKFRYHLGKSPIVYIGTTKIGIRRVAHSAASKAEQIIKEYNCKYLDFYTISASGYPGVAIWEKLERALIIRFRELYGDVPKYNQSFRKARWREEKRYFKESVLDKMIHHFENMKER